MSALHSGAIAGPYGIVHVRSPARPNGKESLLMLWAASVYFSCDGESKCLLWKRPRCAPSGAGAECGIDTWLRWSLEQRQCLLTTVSKCKDDKFSSSQWVAHNPSVISNVRSRISARLSPKASPGPPHHWHLHRVLTSVRPPGCFLSARVPLSSQLSGKKEKPKRGSDIYSITLFHEPTHTQSLYL